MGKNKDENEVLLRYCWPEDVWFHVDDHSSAHVYLRLKAGQSLDDIPQAVLNECCQLVKANSIKASKLDNVWVIYTSFTNLRKEKHMEDGEVGFHDEKGVKRRKVATKDGPLLRKLEKTKKELFPDLRQMREDRDNDEQRMVEHQRREDKLKEKDKKAKQAEEQKVREYRDLFENAAAANNNAGNELKEMTAAQYEEEEFW